jgi:hypothetical protein
MIEAMELLPFAPSFECIGVRLTIGETDGKTGRFLGPRLARAEGAIPVPVFDGAGFDLRESLGSLSFAFLYEFASTEPTNG